MSAIPVIDLGQIKDPYSIGAVINVLSAGPQLLNHIGDHCILIKITVAL
jgi:hypothetical protein